MRVPIWFLSLSVAALLGCGAWNVKTLLDVKERVIRIETQMSLDRFYHQP